LVYYNPNPLDNPNPNPRNQTWPWSKKSTFTDDVPIETSIYAGFPSQPCLIVDSHEISIYIPLNPINSH